MRQFEFARLVPRGVGPCPTHMAEKRSLYVFRRNRSTFEVDQGSAGPGAGLVDLGGDQRLAGARFAGDQNGGVGACHKVNAGHDLTDRGRVSDDVMVCPF